MNHNEEVPDFLGELGDMLPADVLKKVNELLERVHRADKDHQGSPVFIYAPGSQYVDKQFNIGAYPRPLPKGKGADSAEASKSLPDVLATDKAMALWRKAQRAPTRRWCCGGRRSGQATWMSTTSPCSRGRRRHFWPMRWRSGWASRRSGRCSRPSGTASICTTTITGRWNSSSRSTSRTR